MGAYYLIPIVGVAVALVGNEAVELIVRSACGAFKVFHQPASRHGVGNPESKIAIVVVVVMEGVDIGSFAQTVGVHFAIIKEIATAPNMGIFKLPQAGANQGHHLVVGDGEKAVFGHIGELQRPHGTAMLRQTCTGTILI